MHDNYDTKYFIQIRHNTAPVGILIRTTTLRLCSLPRTTLPNYYIRGWQPFSVSVPKLGKYTRKIFLCAIQKRKRCCAPSNFLRFPNISLNTPELKNLLKTLRICSCSPKKKKKKGLQRQQSSAKRRKFQDFLGVLKKKKSVVGATTFLWYAL